MNYIQGIVKVILYHNEENSYTIIKIEVTEKTEPDNLFLLEDGDYLSVTGYFPVPMRGEEIRFFGTLKDHPKYGLQYQIQSFEKLSDTSIPGLIEYLSSDLFPGIGIKTAERVVETLGKHTIKAVLDDPTILSTVPRLSDKQRETIVASLIDNKAAENTLIRLYGYGISPKMAMRIYKYYQTDTIAILEENPYQLIYDIDGIGFERADIIAKQVGFADDHPLRIKAMILYLYQLMGTNYGHTYLYEDQLRDYLLRSLNLKGDLVDESTVTRYLDELIDEDVLVRTDDRIKHQRVVHAESMVIERIKAGADQPPLTLDQDMINDHIAAFEALHDIVYTERQKRAIRAALSQNIFLLTGGPGTGKTTVIKGIVYVYAKMNGMDILYQNPLFSVKLVAPTGRAAKRMSEATNLHAQTIHRFLGYGFDGKFLHNRNQLVDADLIVVDEASMIDIHLASQLFQSIPTSTKIVLVGDEDQLPSVGPGQLLADLIACDLIETVRLDTIHRQAETSKIIDLAYHINEGTVPHDLNKVYPDRLFVEETSSHFQTRLIASLSFVVNKGYDLFKDVQVLIPMYRGSSGIDQVNQLIQDAFNPKQGNAIVHGDREFRHGDKVIQLTNQIEDGIMNGDQGVVVGVTDEDVLIVDFDGIEVAYKKGDLIHLKHAYAMSIHKAQGSEYPVVIMPMFKSYSIMLKRKLIYTGITRAKELLILMGERSSFEYGVTRIEDARQSTLKDDLIAAITAPTSSKPQTSKHTPLPVLDDDLPFDTLGEDLGDVSPYDFLEEE
jgi:exodeoxyribonuclease V alpha subunit